MSEQFNKLQSLLSVGDLTDDVVVTLTKARDQLLSAARTDAEEALLMADLALSSAADGELCIVVMRQIEETMKMRKRSHLYLQSGMDVHALCMTAQETGDEETDDIFRDQETERLNLPIIFALFEAVDVRVENALDLMPDTTRPGARCIREIEEGYAGGPEHEDG